MLEKALILLWRDSFAGDVHAPKKAEASADLRWQRWVSL
jgi:hypothetical protein